jgi:hypothetical protein
VQHLQCCLEPASIYVCARDRSTAAADYVNDSTFRGLVSDILNMKLWAQEMWQLWLKDESMYIVNVRGFSLSACHRMWLSHVRKCIREAAPGSDERRLACLQLLQSKGLAKAAAHGELNAEGEDLIVAAGADGWSAEDVDALLGAGADVATADVGDAAAGFHPVRDNNWPNHFNPSSAGNSSDPLLRHVFFSPEPHIQPIAPRRHLS